MLMDMVNSWVPTKPLQLGSPFTFFQYDYQKIDSTHDKNVDFFSREEV